MTHVITYSISANDFTDCFSEHKRGAIFEPTLSNTWISTSALCSTFFNPFHVYVSVCAEENRCTHIRTTFFTLKFSSGVTSGSWPLSFCKTICWTMRSNSSQYCTVFPLLLSGHGKKESKESKFPITHVSSIQCYRRKYWLHLDPQWLDSLKEAK